MRKWLEQQLLSSLTPYKVDIVEEARRHAEEHGFKPGSGNKWWRLFKACSKDVGNRTPSLVESQRADSRLDEDQWRDFFAKRARTSAEASAAPHTNSRLRRPHTNAFAGVSRNEKRARQCDERSVACCQASSDR